MLVKRHGTDADPTLDDEDLARLKLYAADRETSSEAIAREAVRARAAELTAEEKRALVAEMLARSDKLRIPGVPQTLGVDLIREDRDRDH